MAEADPVLRMRGGARRAIEGNSVEGQRHSHFAALNRDFGLDPDSQKKRAADAAKAERVSPARWLLSVLMFSVLIFGCLQLADMWKAGDLQRALTVPRSKPKAPDLSWMAPGAGANREALANRSDATLPNFLEEPLTLPAPTRAAAPVSDETGEDEG